MKLTPTLYRRIARETKHIRRGEAVYLLQNGHTTIQDISKFKGLVMTDGREILALLKFEAPLTHRQVCDVLEDYFRTRTHLLS